MHKVTSIAVEKAAQIVENRCAKLIKNLEGPGYYHGHFEGYGFRNEGICLDTFCKYHKYAGSYFSPVCTHPNVKWSVEIGGVYKCPDELKSIKLRINKLIRWLRKKI